MQNWHRKFDRICNNFSRSFMKNKIALSCLLGFLFLATTFIFTSAYAQQSYLCVPTKGNGFLKNRGDMSWYSSEMNVEENKFLVKRTSSGWNWSDFGTRDQGVNCGEIQANGILWCDMNNGIAVFNTLTSRFQYTKLGNYLSSKTLNANEPGYTLSIIGTCSALQWAGNRTENRWQSFSDRWVLDNYHLSYNPLTEKLFTNGIRGE